MQVRGVGVVMMMMNAPNSLVRQKEGTQREEEVPVRALRMLMQGD